MDANLARLREAQAHIGAGRLDQAATLLDALAAATPDDARIFLTGAMLAFAARKPRRELAALEHALALAPTWVEAHLELAKAHSRQGHHDQALASVARALELAPSQASVYDVAVAIAHAAGEIAIEQRYLEAAHALSPSNQALRRALAICLCNAGRHAQAETHWRALLLQQPDDPAALGWLGTCLVALGRREEGCTALARAVERWPENPTLQFHLALARGELPRTQPQAMVRKLFDEYAGRFDRHLVGQLKYGVPKRVAQFIKARVPSLHTSVLDLGCGTGLLGAYLGPIDGEFVGVDLSAAMLEQASRHGVYTALRQADLLEELRRTPPASCGFVVANDVFIYFGDLSEAIPAAFAALRAGGTLVFSCESAQEQEGALVLRASRRYAHSPASVQALCRAAGFGACEIETVALRFDAGTEPIPGFIAYAHKH